MWLFGVARAKHDDPQICATDYNMTVLIIREFEAASDSGPHFRAAQLRANDGRGGRSLWLRVVCHVARPRRDYYNTCFISPTESDRILVDKPRLVAPFWSL